MSVLKRAIPMEWRSVCQPLCLAKFTDWHVQNLPLFATTVILGNVAGLPEETMTKFAAYYLAVRVIYTGVYLTNFTRKRAAARSLLWVASVALCLKTMFQAAKAMGR
jgi:uncharacterized MAPEG superfamily protein